MPAVTVSDAPYVLGAGRSLTVQDNDGVLLQSSALSPPTITIGGSIVVTSGAAPRAPGGILSGIRIGDAGFYQTTITIERTGVLKVDTSASALTAFGLNSGSWAPQLSNDGRIEVIAQQDAYGVRHWGTTPQNDTAVANAGNIVARSTLGSAYGVYMGSGDGFANSGQIEVSGGHASYGVYFYQWDSRFFNSGTIRAVTTNPGDVSYAVYATTTFRQGFVNTGVLQGDYALKFLDYSGPGADLVFPQPPSQFDNSGTMIGRVDLGHLRQALTNTGSIQGAVDLGAGDDTYSGALGSVTGMVSGGDGADRMVGGAAFDNFQGNAGSDTVAGGLGDDWVVGGKDGDLLDGEAGADLVYGNIGSDICYGGDGNDIVRGGQDNDVVSGGAGDDYLSGDRGDDTVTGGAGADIFHTFGEAGIDRVTDFSVAQGDRVQLDPGTQYTVAQSGADTVISMTGGGQMILVGVQMSSLTAGWIFGA